MYQAFSLGHYLKTKEPPIGGFRAPLTIELSNQILLELKKLHDLGTKTHQIK